MTIVFKTLASSDTNVMAFSCVIYSSLSPYNDVSAISKHTDFFFLCIKNWVKWKIVYFPRN